MDSQPLFSDVAGLIRIASFKYNESTAFSYQNSSLISGALSFVELDLHSAALAQYFSDELGLSRGSRIAVMLPQCLAFPVVTLGVLRAGLTLVLLDPGLADEELHSQVRASGAVILVGIDSALERAWPVFESSEVRSFISVAVSDFLTFSSRLVMQTEELLRKRSQRIPFGTVSLRQIIRRMEGQRLSGCQWEVSLPLSRELAVMAKESANQSRLMTHAEIARKVSAVSARFGMEMADKDDAILSWLPTHRTLPLVSGLLSFVWLGLRNILGDYSSGPTALRGVLERQRPTWLATTVEGVQALMNQPWAPGVLSRRLRGVVVEGATTTLRDTWERATGLPALDFDDLARSSSGLSPSPVGVRVLSDLRQGLSGAIH